MMPLRHHALSTVILFAVACVGGNAVAQTASQNAGGHSSTAVASPGSTGTGGHDAIDNAVAAALVSAISEQLGGRPVDMRLEAIDVRPLSVRDRTVSGTGSLRIEGEGEDDWMGFRFQVLYDSELDSTGYPEVSIGGITADERDIPNDVQLVQQLDAQVVSALGKDFHQPSVRLQLDRIRTVEAGRRYLRINADGIADFGRDGSTNTQIEAIYDRSSNQWLRVHYEMGSGSEHSTRDVPFVNR